MASPRAVVSRATTRTTTLAVVVLACTTTATTAFSLISPARVVAHEALRRQRRWSPGRATFLQQRHQRAQDDGGIGEVLDSAAAALEQKPGATPEATARRSRALWRAGWLAWWTQLVLSVVSAVVLAFAQAVVPKARIDPLLGGGLLFSTGGLLAAIASVFWAWHYTRLSRKTDMPLDTIQGALRFGVTLNLVGLVLTLVSAEQVVGGLIAKLLLTPGGLSQVVTPSPAAAFRPVPSPVTTLDVFVVQANTNTFASHLAGLLASLWLLSRSRKWQS